jgi:hypothetical protein
MDSGGTYVTTRVVVPQGLCAPETLEKGICGEHHVLDFLNTAVLSTGYRRDILHNPFRCLRFPSPRFSRDDDTLVFVVCVHVIVRSFRDAEDMGRDLETVLATISLKCLLGIYTEICESHTD